MASISSVLQNHLLTALADPASANELITILNNPNATSSVVFTGTGNVTMTAGQNTSFVNKGTGAATQVTLPPSPVIGQTAAVIDAKGDAATNNITVVGAAGATLDGQASYIIAANYGSITVRFNGTEWNVVEPNNWTGTSLLIPTNLSVTGTATVTGVTQLTGGVNENAAAGAAANVNRIVKTLTGLADNTTGTLFTITIPNVLAGGAVRVTVTGILGDGDSTDSKIYMIGVSRIAGSVAKAVASTATAVGATTGASGNATVTVAVPAVTGGGTAVNTFLVTGKVARSAGSASNHVIVAEVEVLNGFAGGITLS